MTHSVQRQNVEEKAAVSNMSEIYQHTDRLRAMVDYYHHSVAARVLTVCGCRSCNEMTDAGNIVLGDTVPLSIGAGLVAVAHRTNRARTGCPHTAGTGL